MDSLDTAFKHSIDLHYLSHELINVVNNTVSTALNSLNAKKELLLSIEEVRVNVLQGSIYRKGIPLTPRKVHYEKFIRGATHQKMLTDVHVSEIALTSLGFKTVFWDKKIDPTSVRLRSIASSYPIKRKHLF